MIRVGVAFIGLVVSIVHVHGYSFSTILGIRIGWEVSRCEGVKPSTRYSSQTYFQATCLLIIDQKPAMISYDIVRFRWIISNQRMIVNIHWLHWNPLLISNHYFQSIGYNACRAAPGSSSPPRLKALLESIGLGDWVKADQHGEPVDYHGAPAGGCFTCENYTKSGHHIWP